jgi:benzoate transport
MSGPRRPDDPRALLREGPMGAPQVLAIGLCILINMMDGFDILASGFSGPAISRAWGLTPTQLGLLFSSGLAGMTLGALFLSPLADVWGRRRLVLGGLVLIGAGMFASAAAGSLGPLLAARAVTGAGVGAVMATLNTVVAEYASDRRRDLAVCLQACGFPLGGALGGFGVYLIADLSWRWVYVAGGAVAVLLAPAVLAWLPESYDFLIAVRPPRALERVNRLSRRLGLPVLAALPDPAAGEGGAAADGAPERASARATALICASFFLLMFTFYFLTNWTPKLLTDYGFSARLGVSGAAFMNLGGVAGDLVFAALTLRWPAARLGPLFLGGAFAAVAVVALSPLTLPRVLPLAFAIGFLLFGAMASLYAVAPAVFPARRRVSGTGLALGLGRIGAAAGPYVGGLVIGLAWPRSQYLLALAAPLMLCAATLLALRPPVPGRPPAAAGLRSPS